MKTKAPELPSPSVYHAIAKNGLRNVAGNGVTWIPVRHVAGARGAGGLATALAFSPLGDGAPEDGAAEPARVAVVEDALPPRPRSESHQAFALVARCLPSLFVRLAPSLSLGHEVPVVHGSNLPC
jgi:hypothetical protein